MSRGSGIQLVRKSNLPATNRRVIVSRAKDAESPILLICGSTQAWRYVNMTSPQIRTGTRVRVKSPTYPELADKTGTVINSYGHPDYQAFEVQLDDGRKVLFWYYQLVKAGEN
jgi:hypothetical protein